MHWTVQKLIEATGGQLLSGAPQDPVAEISTDTRTIGPGDCFIALCGENRDGHDFIRDAQEKGATAALVSRSKEDLVLAASNKISLVRVPDTLYGLGELARFWRLNYSIPVIGITGSNGKTSTKEMLAAILGQKRNVLKNKGNFNNLIGAPLTLLSLRPEHEAAVVEMGINVPGEMARLAEICRPTVGLITNIHPTHLEGLQSMDLIFEEKSKLWAGLGEKDLAVVNLDDERLSTCLKAIRAKTVTYSLKDGAADVRLKGEVETGNGESSFYLALGSDTVSVRLGVLGLHHVQNALGAAAAAWGLGELPEDIAQGLCSYKPVRQRMQMHRLADGRTLIDDTYNANPASMLAAVQTVSAACLGRPVIAVLGEMRELGPQSASLHRALGRKVGELGISRLVTLGELGREILAGASEGGMRPIDCMHAKSHEEAVSWIRENYLENAWIIVKGSRGMTMERVVEGLLREDGRD